CVRYAVSDETQFCTITKMSASANPMTAKYGHRSWLRVSRPGLGLPRQLWLVEVGVFLNTVGYGAVLPFEIIYLHDGRGFSVAEAGLIVGAITGVAVLTAPLTGPLIDRFG